MLLLLSVKPIEPPPDSEPDPRAAPPPEGTDPTEYSVWRPFRLLHAALDDEIHRLYVERGLGTIKPRFTMVLIRIDRRGPMTIRQLAGSLELTHSALSQTVGALRKEGLVISRTGADARTREIHLTEKARELVPFLEAEWRATENVIAELEAEIPYPMNQVIRDIGQALARKPFYDRLLEHLDERFHPGGRSRPDGENSS